MRSNRRKKVHEQFHQQTDVHHRLIKRNNFTYRNILDIAEKYIVPGNEILDVGCGSGTLSLYLASKGSRVLGLDISVTAIDQCKKSARNLDLEENTEFKVIDFPNEIPKEKYDMVLLTEVIEHLENDKLAIKKIHSLLKPDSTVLITTPSKNAPLFKMGLATEFDKKVGHVRRYTISELEDLLTSEGFTILETKKTEGILRNFLFLNPVAGKSIRFIKYFISDVVTYIDNISCKLFGESNIIIVAQKI